MILKLTEPEAQAVQLALVYYINDDRDTPFDERLKPLASDVSDRLMALRDGGEG